MKRPSFRMVFCYIVGLFIMGLSSWLIASTSFIGPALVRIHWLVALLPAIFISLLALLVCLAAEGVILHYYLSFPVRHCLSWVSYLLNAIASGFAVGALMADKGILPNTTLLLCLLPTACLAVLLLLIDQFPNISHHKTTSILFCALDIALILLGIWAWVCDYVLVGCTTFFSALFFLLFPIGIRNAIKKPSEWHRYLSHTGFGAFILILLAVILILSDGEALDSLDFGDWPFNSKKTHSGKTH